MNRLAQLTWFGCLAGVLVTVAGCAPITVSTYTGRDVQMTAYRTFGWGIVDSGVPGDPRLDNNPFFHEYLRDAIDRQLTSRGYEPALVQPELNVRYHASATQKIYINGQEPTVERCPDCAVQVYDAGTILVDLTDARTGVLVWRGVAETGLAGVVGDQSRMESAIERVVSRMFARLPRRS